MAILLVDCQGTGDTSHSSPHLDTIIFYISLQLANVQVFNLVKQLTSNDVERLKVRDFARKNAHKHLTKIKLEPVIEKDLPVNMICLSCKICLRLFDPI